MKTVRLKIDSILVLDRHYKKGDVLPLADSAADHLVAAGQAEYADGADPVRPVNPVNPLADAVDPLVPNADPAHAARALSLDVAAHPGLLDLNAAGLASVPKRSGRLAPEATPVDPVVPVAAPAVDLTKAPKPKG